MNRGQYGNRDQGRFNVPSERGERNFFDRDSERYRDDPRDQSRGSFGRGFEDCYPPHQREGDERNISGTGNFRNERYREEGFEPPGPSRGRDGDSYFRPSQSSFSLQPYGESPSPSNDFRPAISREQNLRDQPSEPHQWSFEDRRNPNPPPAFNRGSNLQNQQHSLSRAPLAFQEAGSRFERKIPFPSSDFRPGFNQHQNLTNPSIKAQERSFPSPENWGTLKPPVAFQQGRNFEDRELPSGMPPRQESRGYRSNHGNRSTFEASSFPGRGTYQQNQPRYSDKDNLAKQSDKTWGTATASSFPNQSFSEYSPESARRQSSNLDTTVPASSFGKRNFNQGPKINENPPPVKDEPLSKRIHLDNPPQRSNEKDERKENVTNINDYFTSAGTIQNEEKQPDEKKDPPMYQQVPDGLEKKPSSLRHFNESLRVFIVNESHPKGMFSNHEIKTLKSFLRTEIIKENSFSPVFQWHSVSEDGFFEVIGADQRSLNWLSNKIKTSQPITNIKLQIYSNDKNPFKVQKATCLFSGFSVSMKNLFKRLEAQNPGLSTRDWTVYKHFTKPNKGVLLFFGLDKTSLDYLRAQDFCPYFGLGRSFIKVVDIMDLSEFDEYLNPRSQLYIDF